MSSTFDHHVDDTPSTSDSVVKSRKGKVKNHCLLCKDNHFTYLCPFMDEASKWLEDIIVPHQQLPTGYRKLSLDIPLVDKVVDPFLTSIDPTLPLKSEVEVIDLVPSLVDPTLPLKSEVEVVNSVSSVVDPTLPLKGEVKVVELTPSPPNPTLSSESVKTEVVSLTNCSSCSSLPVENELKLS